MKLKQFFSSSKGKTITLCLLFFIASLSTYYGWELFIPIVPHYGRLFDIYFPTLFTFGIPLLSFFMLWMYWHVPNVRTKWKIQLTYSLIVMILMAICIVFHLITIHNHFSWTSIYGVISLLFPFDVLAMMVIYLGIGIYVYIKAMLNKAIGKVEKTVPEVMRKRAYVGAGFIFAFTAYYTGLFFQFFSILDSFDENWYGIVPTLIIFLLPLTSLILYVIYKHKITINKQKVFIYSMLALLLACFLLFGWLMLAIYHNPYLFSESLSNFFMLGYAAKLPIGLMVLIILLFVELLIAIRRYARRYITLKDEVD